MNAFCVCSSLLNEEVLCTLRSEFPVIPLPPDPLLAPPIQCHPDSIFTVIGDTLIVPGMYYALYSAVIDKIASLGNFRILPTQAPRGSVYPLDTGLNAAVGRDFVICRRESAAPELLETAEKNGMRVIPVRQGYAGCSCLITDAAVLTFDVGIARALERYGISHLLLPAGGISLPGYGDGFFGGACGWYDGTIFVSGNTGALPCCASLTSFAEAHGYTIRSLSTSPVTDAGGLRFYPIQ